MNDVATPTKAHNAMVEAAAPVRTLVAGTKAMREAGQTYLPKAEAESDTAYKARLKRSVLFNAVGKTVEDMSGKVFVKPVVLEKDVPADLVSYAEDIDLAGRHLNVFAENVFSDAFQPGVGYIYVDMPKRAERTDGQTPTLADEKGIRPYLTYVPMERLIGWKSATVDGVETLTQIRIKECVSEQDGEFGETEVDQIRVVEPGIWRTFRKVKDGNGEKWDLHESDLIVSKSGNLLNYIPLVPVYIKRHEFMQGCPPLGKMADLNVAHWQSSSDQKNILHVARVPILYGAGFAADQKIVVGSQEMIFSTDPQAKLAYVEHSGAAIAAGQTDLDKLEFQMQAMGLQLLVPQPGGKTATGEIRDDAKINSPLAMAARALQDALEQAFEFMAQMNGAEWKRKDGGGSIVVNTDFGVQSGNAADAQMLLDAVNGGQIDKETFWLEWKRRGILHDSFDPEVAKARIAEEAPKLDAGPGKGMNLGA